MDHGFPTIPCPCPWGLIELESSSANHFFLRFGLPAPVARRRMWRESWTAHCHRLRLRRNPRPTTPPQQAAVDGRPLGRVQLRLVPPRGLGRSVALARTPGSPINSFVRWTPSPSVRAALSRRSNLYLFSIQDSACLPTGLPVVQLSPF